jgi:hypothetical protein
MSSDVPVQGRRGVGGGGTGQPVRATPRGEGFAQGAVNMESWPLPAIRDYGHDGWLFK